MEYGHSCPWLKRFYELTTDRNVLAPMSLLQLLAFLPMRFKNSEGFLPFFGMV